MRHTITLSEKEYALLLDVLGEVINLRESWAREEAEEAAIYRKNLRKGRVAAHRVSQATVLAEEAREYAATYRKEARALSRLARTLNRAGS